VLGSGQHINHTPRRITSCCCCCCCFEKRMRALCLTHSHARASLRSTAARKSLRTPSRPRGAPPTPRGRTTCRAQSPAEGRQTRGPSRSRRRPRCRRPWACTRSCAFVFGFVVFWGGGVACADARVERPRHPKQKKHITVS
jgi:hypothetical protein